MRKIIAISLIFLSSLAAWAAPQGRGDRSQWMTEMRQYKRAYLTKELDLSSQQESKFFPLYEDMEDEIARINDEARSLEKKVADMDNATDADYEKATEAVYNAKTREAAIEREYLDKFKTILSPRQMFRLKAVERSFNRELMKQHHRLRSRAKAADK